MAATTTNNMLIYWCLTLFSREKERTKMTAESVLRAARVIRPAESRATLGLGSWTMEALVISMAVMAMMPTTEPVIPSKKEASV